MISNRDYFATAIAPAFAQLLFTNKKAAAHIREMGESSYAVGVAKMAYGIADAMLAERDKIK